MTVSRRAPSGTQSIERAFAIIREVKAATPGGVTVAALAGKVRLNRTTAHRMVGCLMEQGALGRKPGSAAIVLGPLLVELGVAAREPLDLKALFSPALTRIAERTGDTAFLLVRAGDDAVCLDRRSGSYPVKTLVVEVGTRRPLGVGAGSVAILSALDELERQRVVRANTAALRSWSIEARVLQRTLLAARRAGYASTRVQGVDGVMAIGVPIRDATGAPIAAVSMAAVSSRMTRARRLELKDVLAAEAAGLTEMLERGPV